MSTHDYNLANQSGASFRSDLNNCLAAILSNNSNGSAPSTTVAYSIWADTTAGKLKIRNAANDGFVDLINLDGTIQRDVSLTGDLTLTDKIIHSGDTNTAIRFPADDTFSIETAGSERARVDSSGRLLINTTSTSLTPKLQVTAATDAEAVAIFGRAADDISSFSFYENDQSTKLGELQYRQDHVNFRHRVGYIAFATGGTTERMRIDSSGNLGIGTTSPNQLLTLSSATPRVLLTQTTNNSNCFLDCSTAGSLEVSVDDNNVDSNSKFQVRLDGATAGLTLDSTGLGVGTTSPRARLDLGNGISVATSITRVADRYQLLLDASDTSDAFGNNIGFILNGGSTVVACINAIEEGGNGSTGLSFATSSNSGNDPVEAIRIDESQKVGIGTTSPSQQMDLSSTAPNIRLTDTADGHSELDGNAASLRFIADKGNAKASTTITFLVDNTERVRLDSNGHFLFNCTSIPSSSVAGLGFEKNGNTGVLFHSSASTANSNAAEFVNSNGVVGRITTSGSNCSFTDVSDYRLKENEVLISDGITRLKQLKPYRFNYKTDSSQTFDGFFAHEAQAVVPESVVGEKDATKKDGSIDPQCIDQSKLVPLLVAAVQELIGKVAALEAA